MNVGIGTGAAPFLFWEYLFRIFGTVSLQCTVQCITYKLRKVTGKKKKNNIFKAANWKFIFKSRPQWKKPTKRITAAAFNNQLTDGEGKSCLHEREELIAATLNCIRVRDRKNSFPHEVIHQALTIPRHT
jgi:hypothetical protein